uniref:Mitochondrial carrier protein n=1 Tax=Palpitomonas bilix TaxID=652834 RepID=A0A7S3GFI2_9EUKA|mmetsp:Transcript_4722/g.9905  ORF Transcript_4722/g.9905 Transcript_4722/m.9905 type:complete len:296 (+) Transcript_4722:171-1058(+)
MASDAPRPFKDLIAGCFAGIGADFLLHPVDTVRARMQVERVGTKGGSTMTQAARAVLRDSGISGFYRGVKTTVLLTGPAHALYFSGYEMAKRQLRSLDHKGDTRDEAIYALASGLFANFCGAFVWVPMDVVKQKMQVHGGTLYHRDTDALRDVLRKEGPRGLYRGFGAAFLTYGPFSGIYFAMYEAQKSLFLRLSRSNDDNKERLIPFYASLAFAAGAGGIAAAVTCPLDVVKTRMQVEGRSGEAYKNTFDGLWKVANNEGFAGLFRGVQARVTWIAPSCAVTMVLYEEFKKILL